MAINVNDLPPKYQRQALEKYMEQQARRGLMPSAAVPQEKAKANKYHNTPTERVTASGAVLHFDSQKEARRYDVLAARLQAGQIRDLRLQVEFTLQEAYTDTEGRRVRAGTRRILHTKSGTRRRRPWRPPKAGRAKVGAMWWRT